ncbi:MAG: hypothetical protein Q9196_003791 [Gyalolechia fulgens]
MTPGLAITHSERSQAQSLLVPGSSSGGLHENSSAMDIDPVAADNVALRNPVSINTSTWYDPTAQALSNHNCSSQAGKTQDEQHNTRREARKRTRSNRRCRAVISKTSRQAAVEACDRNGTCSRDTSERLKKATQELQKGRLKRREMIRMKKRAALNKAEEVARTKALERALGCLNLDASKSQSNEEQPRPLPLLLSFDHVLCLFSDPSHARKAFADLQQHQRDPSYADGLCLGDQRRLRSLLEEEHTLQSKAQETGSTEAALLHQDQRVAYMNELRASTGDLPLKDHGLSDNPNERYTPNLHYFPLTSKTGQRSGVSTDPVLQRSGPFIPLTDKGKAMDVQTANDVAAYQENPSTILSKKRRKRVLSALSHGRADLNAMQLEKHRANTEKVAKELKELTEKGDVCRPLYETKVQPSVEKRDLYQPRYDTRMQVPTAKRDLYQPEHNPRLQVQLPSREQSITTVADRPIGTTQFLDSYRPGRGAKTHTHESRSIGGDEESPLMYGDDFYRPYSGISSRTPRFRHDNSRVLTGTHPIRVYESYRPGKRSKQPVSEASSGRKQDRTGAPRTGLIDSYRPADGSRASQP